MRERWKRWALEGSFRHKLIIASIACLLIPTLITLSVSNVLTRDAVKEQAVANAQDQLKLVDGNVSGLFKYMLYISNYILVEPEMRVILQEQAKGKQYTGENSEYREFADKYYTITNKIDNISIVGEKTYVTILLPNGRFFINYMVEEYDPRLLFQESWFKELDRLQGMDTYWVESHPSQYLYEKTIGRHQISVARTLRWPNKQIYAYVIVTVTENQIRSIFERMASGQEIMLVDGNNRIQSHVDTSRIGEELPYLASADGDYGIVRLDGEDYLVTSQPTSVQGWKLVLLTPYKDAISKINQIFENVFVYQIAIFAVFLVLLIWLIRMFTKPLVRLGKLAHTVQRGNLEVRSHIRGSDEIGRLGSSFDQMLDRIKQMIAEITAEQSRKRKAELAMLQAQINPHFLFNVLNSIRMKVLRKGDKESAEMISSLSRLLRMTIDRDEETITLHEEVSTAMDYMNLMNMRQKEKVLLAIDISSEAMLARVPRFFLQPVIENALIHALHQRSGTVRVTAAVEEQSVLKLAVRDDGTGMNERALSQLRNRISSAESGREQEEPRSGGFSGIGLANVYERMRMRFGEAFVMSIDSKEGHGTVVTMLIPIKEVLKPDVQSNVG
ncbi:cache domain-containing sensor histidine kinase [Paenibacillus alkalitolerans]|uniref:cache domain-containing sensor histidine kinase n=1 Tax=Paenibacillus alkalitolerans TaxID=2799335 RepID=UPI0018F55CD3|nr:sensor histidine kinase [Paenibacillus alkalitolerans]